jgi:hypothetical protein
MRYDSVARSCAITAFSYMLLPFFNVENAGTARVVGTTICKLRAVSNMAHP